MIMLHCMNGKRDIANVIKVINVSTSQMTQQIKNLLAIQETQELWVQSLGQEDPVEKEMATHSSIYFLKNPMDREAWWAIVHEGHK